jgi:hypothetical protein
MDVLAAGAVRELLSYDPARPVLLSEVGAVEPRHAGPWKLYEKDPEGTLLHDMLFAPFFSGAAGPGQPWHWDFYIERHNLWHHFARFARVVKGVDPRVEKFVPEYREETSLRIYTLRGRRTTLIWLRDALSDWRTEIAEGAPAAPRRGVRLPVNPSGSIEIYAPWKNSWQRVRDSSGTIELPEFRRSLVLRLRNPR